MGWQLPDRAWAVLLHKIILSCAWGEENKFLVQALPLNAQTAVVLQNSGIEFV
jgi:hypothetical protein